MNTLLKASGALESTSLQLLQHRPTARKPHNGKCPIVPELCYCWEAAGSLGWVPHRRVWKV